MRHKAFRALYDVVFRHTVQRLFSFPPAAALTFLSVFCILAASLRRWTLKSFFTPTEVARLIGISYRQIQYWDKTSFIKPSYRRRGRYRLYTFSDLVLLRIVKLQREHGASIQRLRRLIRSLKGLLPRFQHPLVEATFLMEGERVLIMSGDILMDPATAGSYIRFDVRSLCEEINKAFPDRSETPRSAAA